MRSSKNDVTLDFKKTTTTLLNMKIATMIFAGLCRIATEYGMPVLAFFVFSLPVAIAILVAFLAWQIISAIYLGPMYKKQMDDAKKLESKEAAFTIIDSVRIELIGHLPDSERMEIVNTLRERFTESYN